MVSIRPHLPAVSLISFAGTRPRQAYSASSPGTDTVHFSGRIQKQVQKNTPADLARQMLNVSGEMYIPSDFIETTQAALTEALTGMPEALRNDIAEEKLRVLLYPHGQAAANDETVVKALAGKLDERDVDLENVLANMAASCAELDPATFDLLQNLIDLPVEEQLLLATKLLLLNGPEPFYLKNEATIVMPYHRLSDDSLPFQRSGQTKKGITHMFRHEMSHFIDLDLGAKYTGKPFSADMAFLAAISGDKKNGLANNTWPDSMDVTEDGLPLHHYFMGHDDIERDSCEAYAEIMGYLLGGGAMDGETLQKHYTKGIQTVQEKIQSVYNVDLPAH